MTGFLSEERPIRKLREVLGRLKEAYCGTVGYEVRLSFAVCAGFLLRQILRPDSSSNTMKSDHLHQQVETSGLEGNFPVSSTVHQRPRPRPKYSWGNDLPSLRMHSGSKRQHIR